QPLPEGEGQVTDLLGVELHQPATGRVHRHRVAAHHQGTQRPGGAVQRAVPFHADDAVHDRQVRRPGQCDIDDAVVDPPPVQLVLGPSITDAGERAEEVLQGQGCPGPVVRLQLGQGDQDVGRGGRAGQVEVVQLRQPAQVEEAFRLVV